MCKRFGLERHPARYPEDLPSFFIKMLTEPGDLVLDIFAGSNTTGRVAERLARQWLSFDNSLEYLKASVFRFIEGMSEGAAGKVLVKLETPEANLLLPRLPRDGLLFETMPLKKLKRNDSQMTLFQ